MGKGKVLEEIVRILFFVCGRYDVVIWVCLIVRYCCYVLYDLYVLNELLYVKRDEKKKWYIVFFVFVDVLFFLGCFFVFVFLFYVVSFG